jgi:hypothetical protein
LLTQKAKNNQQLTNGLALGWLDVVLPQLRFYNLAFVWGWTNIAELFFVTFNPINFIGLRYRAGRYKCQPSAKPRPVVRHAIKHSNNLK